MAPHQIPIEASIDLHNFRPGEIKEVVKEYLHQAIKQGLREVRIVHGRGIGVQRESVRKLLAVHPGVSWFGDAPENRGGWGATLVQFGDGPMERQEQESANEPEEEQTASSSLFGWILLGSALILACLFLLAVVWRLLQPS